MVAVVEGRSNIGDAEMVGGIEAAGFYLNEHLRLTGAGRTDHDHAMRAGAACPLAEREHVIVVHAAECLL